MSRISQKSFLLSALALLLLGTVWFVTSFPWGTIFFNTITLVIALLAVIVYFGVIVFILRRLFRKNS